MANQKDGNKTTDMENQNVQNGQAANPPADTTQKAPDEQKTGIGAWLKKHWKGVTAAGLGVGTAVTSAFVAYKKGKAAGIMSVPVPQGEPEDYSLNPNE